MEKYFIIIAYNGAEVIDSTPEAENRINVMDYLEERYIREKKRKSEHKRKIAGKLLYRLACFCGIV